MLRASPLVNVHGTARDRRILADQPNNEIVDLSAHTDSLTKELLWEISQQARGSARQLVLSGWRGVCPVS